jgi:carboxypeptidase Taq
MSATVSTDSAVGKLRHRAYQINAVTMAIGLMDWDQQCYMPPGGADARAEHVGILSQMRFDLETADETGRLIEDAEREAAPNSEDAALVRVMKRSYNLATKLPSTLTAEKSRLGALAHEEWVKARKNNDFATFSPWLEKMFDLTRQEAECYGYTNHIYDALIDLYEEGATEADCRRMYDTLKTSNVALIKAIGDSPIKPDDSKLYGTWDVSKQRAFTELIVKEIGFDMENGRQDTAPHPFCANFSTTDVRLTTRFKDHIGSAIFGSLHEAGHGMYEQGSPKKWDRTPLAGGVSLGIHESQSRTWENIVGRSRAFWSRFLPRLQEHFPALNNFDLNTWYSAINKVQPSFIRVEADEVTYNMHTLVRFEIECDVLSSKMNIKDIPDAWNSKYQDYLGVTPETDSVGCLQDVHWSAGLIGYFPTYSMGNCLSYQFWNCLTRDLGDVNPMMAEGNFAPILGWLKENIYQHGCHFQPKDLVQMVSGKPIGAEDYLEGLKAKYSEIYAL